MKLQRRTEKDFLLDLLGVPFHGVVNGGSNNTRP